MSRQLEPIDSAMQATANTAPRARGSRNRKLWIAIIMLLLAAGAAYALSRSTLLLDKASARFSAGDHQMNRLVVEAPYGTSVVTYTVIPRIPPDAQHPFQLGSKGSSRSIGLFEKNETRSNSYPDTGAVESIPLEQHVRISGQLDTAATAALPEDRKLLERCGLYLVVTKDPGLYGRLESLVSDWTVEPGSQAAK